MDKRSDLPKFQRPPVSEVALSVQFSPLKDWRSPHAGLYWGRIQTRYPKTESHPPLPSQIERFGADFLEQPQFRIEIASPERARVWFLSEPPTYLIQVQSDRFVVNWRKLDECEKYPQYFNGLRQRFKTEWEEFFKFLSEQKIGTADVQQCELTYVNTVFRGDGWNDYAGAIKLLRRWWDEGSADFLPQPETLGITGSFQMPGERGRLHFVVQPAFSPVAQKDALQLQLIARGKPASNQVDDVLGWMDLAHEWIVRGFVDLTSPVAHKLWERTK
jgi:uncharacterized protein (TIGR04255 family)